MKSKIFFQSKEKFPHKMAPENEKKKNDTTVYKL